MGQYWNCLYIVGTCMISFCVGAISPRTYNIDIYSDKSISPLDHFWESTGMCPPLPHPDAADYFLSRDMLQNLVFVGTVPHRGIKQVRMHWLLDMVIYDKEKDVYDFSKLDALFVLLDKYGLKPGFELMGNPSGKFSNFDDKSQVLDWMKLVTTIGQRYVNMFGLDKVSRWNYETWNEPDHKDFDDIVMSVDGFLKYYDACSEGLKSVSESLKFGGPGGSCRKESFSKRCWALLSHCVDGKNYITGENGSRIDYIAMHKKGEGKANYIIETEQETITKIHSLHPSLKSTPIYNDEGDPMVGWSTPYPWRADVTYPAVVAKVIAEHQCKIIANQSDPTNYALLSNDNGFLSFSPHYFTQRTLSARFQMNMTRPRYVHLVRKSILALMGLLAKLGDVQLNAVVQVVSDYSVGAIASKCDGKTCSDELTVLLYASDDTSATTNNFVTALNFHNLSATAKPAMLVKCSIDNLSTNPWKIWKNAGSPDFPPNSLFRAMHKASEPLCTDPVEIDTSTGRFTVNSSLPLPGVLLYHICWKTPSAPAAPVMQSVHNITSGQVLVSWSDLNIQTKCIKTYEVELCHSSRCYSCKKLNPYKIIFNSFVYISPSNDKDVSGFYRVRVQDFWDRFSPYSTTFHYPM